MGGGGGNDRLKLTLTRILLGSTLPGAGHMQIAAIQAVGRFNFASVVPAFWLSGLLPCLPPSALHAWQDVGSGIAELTTFSVVVMTFKSFPSQRTVCEFAAHLLHIHCLLQNQTQACESCGPTVYSGRPGERF